MKKKRTGISANITRRTEMPDAKHAIERGKTSEEKRTDSSSLLGDRVLSTSLTSVIRLGSIGRNRW